MQHRRKHNTDKVVSIQEAPREFTRDEVENQKYADLVDCSSCESIIADAAIRESDLDLAASGHNANTGDGMVILPVGGKVTLKIVDLGRVPDHVMILDGDFDGIRITFGPGNVLNSPKIGDALMLPSPTRNVAVIFENTSDAVKTLTSYALGY